jgi:hypothetical protein
MDADRVSDRGDGGFQREIQRFLANMPQVSPDVAPLLLQWAVRNYMAIKELADRTIDH